MRRVGVRMDEANADRGDARVAKEARGGADAFLVEWPQFFAKEIETPADFAHVAQRHDALRLHPEIGIAVALGHRLTGDFEDMSEARR